LAFVRDVRGHAGDELQIIHHLLFGAVLAITIADLALRLDKRQPLQRKQRPDHVFAHPLGLRLGLSTHAAMHGESRVAPGENARGPFGAQKLPADKRGEDLPGEELSQSRVVDPWDLVEDARLVHSALGHQEMEVGVKTKTFTRP
jgi:hypothetical protein